MKKLLSSRTVVNKALSTLLSLALLFLIFQPTLPVYARASEYYNIEDANNYSVGIGSDVREQRFADLIAMCSTNHLWQNDIGGSKEAYEVVAVYNSNWIKQYIDILPDNPSRLPKHYYTDGQKYQRGYDCFGFANFALWYTSAADSSKDVWQYLVTTPAQTFDYSHVNSFVQKGDVLRLAKTTAVGPTDHSVFVISVDSDGIMVCDANRQSDHMLRYSKIYYNNSAWHFFTATRVYVDVYGTNPATLNLARIARAEEGYYSSGNTKYSAAYGYSTTQAAGWFVKWCCDQAGVPWANPSTAASITSAFNYATASGKYHGNVTHTWSYGGKSGSSTYDPNFNFGATLGCVVFLESGGTSGLNDGPDAIGIVVGSDYGVIDVAIFNSQNHRVEIQRYSAREVAVWGYYQY